MVHSLFLMNGVFGIGEKCTFLFSTSTKGRRRIPSLMLVIWYLVSLLSSVAVVLASVNALRSNASVGHHGGGMLAVGTPRHLRNGRDDPDLVVKANISDLIYFLEQHEEESVKLDTDLMNHKAIKLARLLSVETLYFENGTHTTL